MIYNECHTAYIAIYALMSQEFDLEDIYYRAGGGLITEKTNIGWVLYCDIETFTLDYVYTFLFFKRIPVTNKLQYSIYVNIKLFIIIRAWRPLEVTRLKGPL